MLEPAAWTRYVAAVVQPHELDQVTVPRAVWARSRRPLYGELIRAALATGLVVAGLLSGSWVLAVLLVAFAMVSLFVLPRAVDARLQSIEREIERADTPRARAMLGRLEQRRIVRLFAPHGWTALQRGRLHTRLGDGRAAAHAFAECGRLCADPENFELVRSRARALVLAGDRRDARELFEDLGRRKALTAADHLGYAVALLHDSGRHKQALDHLARVRNDFGQITRYRAAKAVALARADRLDEAFETFAAIEPDDVSSDPVAEDLVKRARKLLKAVIDSRAKQERRPDPTRETKAKRASAKSERPDRRKERRERRRQAKARRRENMVEAKPVVAPASARPTTSQPSSPVQPSSSVPTRPTTSQPSSPVQPSSSVPVSGPSVPRPPAAATLFAPPPRPAAGPSTAPRSPTTPILPPPPVVRAPPKVDGGSLRTATAEPAPDDGWADLLGDEAPVKPAGPTSDPRADRGSRRP